MIDSTQLIPILQKEVDEMVREYKGMKVSDLKIMVGEHKKDTKASFASLARKMLRITNNRLELMSVEIEVTLKTVRITGSSNPAESMSFTTVDFDKWVSANTWEESPLYKYFNNHYFIFFVFKQYPSGRRVEDNEMTFHDVKVWKMSDYDLNHGLKEVWKEVCRLIEEDELEIESITQRSGRVINKNNLPSIKFNYLGHLRPGGENGDDKVLLPTGQKIAKQRFWFNAKYVKEIIGL